MIYLDTSVALAHVFAEDRRPPEALWEEALVSSRLLEYELWNRVNASSAIDRETIRPLLSRIAFVELARPVLARAMEPFPAPVRTLDALHLASAAFLWEREKKLRLATYDDRMVRAAKAMKLPLYQL